MRDIIGYEEKNPATMRHVCSAYPRFVVHPFIVRLTQHLASTQPELAGRTLWLTSTGRMADALAEHLRKEAAARTVQADVRRFTKDDMHGVSFSGSASELGAAAKTFLQNIGGFFSSREAEDRLLRLKLLAARHPEVTFPGDATAEIRRVLQRAFQACRDEDLLLTNSGMNAMYTAFVASSSIQSARGRTIWVQLGWLYRDTIAILQKFTASPSDYVYIRDPLDLDAVSRIFSKFGARIAGVVAELPTNPLVRTPDLPALGRLCRSHGAHLIVDPSVASPFSVDVLGHADVAITSLTKYTASEGDVIAGLIAINPAGGDASVLRERCATLHEPLYSRDRARLAAEIGETEAVVAQIGRNAARVVEFLRAHPKIRDVFWARREDSRANFDRIARSPERIGGMVTFTIRDPLEPFVDRLRLPKGPSFGMKTTLACPFMYMAHFDLTTTPAGIAELAASGLDPDLMRLCVGTEPVEDIIDALKEALGS